MYRTFRRTMSSAYQVVPLTAESAPKLSEFLVNHFLVEEPLNRATGMSRKSFQPFVDKLFERTLNIPFSYAVIDKDSSEIVACAMSSLWKNEAVGEQHGDEFEFDSEKNLGVEAVGKILTELHAKFYKLKPQIKAVLHLEILSVSKDHQRRGIASLLMDKMEDAEKIRSFESCTGIASEISSLANQCLMKKRKYTEICETLLSSEVGPDGKPLIVTDDGTEKVVLVFKEFK